MRELDGRRYSGTLGESMSDASPPPDLSDHSRIGSVHTKREATLVTLVSFADADGILRIP